MKDFEFVTKQKEIIKGQSWEIKNPKGNVIIFEGMEEHVSRYDKFAKFLNENGYSVYGLDLYGQGRNVNEDLSNRGDWPDNAFDKMVENNAELVASLSSQVPTYIFAHSLGSFLGQAYLELFPDTVEKIVLCGSGGRNPMLGIGKALATLICTKKKANKPAKTLNNLMFGGFNKKIENPKTPFDWLSYNEENVNTYIADPLCGYGPKNKFCYEFICGMSRLYKKERLSKVSKNSKIFIISGEEDPVTNYGKFVNELTDMYHELGVSHVENKIYNHMRHEILNEKDWAVVAQDVVDFYNK